MEQQQPKELSPIQQLCLSTVRIVASNSQIQSVGTGFIVNYLVHGAIHPFVVTNKHVVDKMDVGELVFCTKMPGGIPNYLEHITYTAKNFESRWLKHPDTSVDLCVMPLEPFLKFSVSKSEPLPCYRAFNMSDIPDPQQFSSIGAGDKIMMIGYPNSIWDSVHNMPIVRQGITATDVNLDYEGRKEFLIDATVVPGSSGSPIFIYDRGGFSDTFGNVSLGTSRLMLLGVNYASFYRSVDGSVELKQIPTNAKLIAHTSIPINLGVVIKSSRLLEFIPLIDNIGNEYMLGNQG